MDKSDTITRAIAKLTSSAKTSVKKGDSGHNLKTFQMISETMGKLVSLGPIKGDQITACIRILSLLSDLEQQIIKSNLPLKQVPHIHETAGFLNDLFVKSAKDALKSGDKAYITQQCEALLTAADQIREDRHLRTSGILNVKLKTIIGRLREKADIINMFEDNEIKGFIHLMEKAEAIIDTNRLDEIGEAFENLRKVGVKLKNKYTVRAKFNQYLIGYKKNYLVKIVNRLNRLKAGIWDADLFECKDLLEDLKKLENLHKFHQETRLTNKIKFFRNKVLKVKYQPIEKTLDQTIKFILSAGNTYFGVEYESIYDRTYGENELFVPEFYDKVLRGVPPLSAVDILKEKKERMRQIDIGKAGQAEYEDKLKANLNTLIQQFEASAAAGAEQLNAQK